MKGRNTIVGLLMAAVIVGFAASVMAEPNNYWSPQSGFISTVTAGSVSNATQLIDCRSGKEVFLEASFRAGTNAASTAAYGTTTNVTFFFRPCMGPGGQIVPMYGETTANMSAGTVPVIWTLTIPWSIVGTNYFATTNYSLAGVPYLQWYVTNTCGLDANCKITNVMVRAYLK